MRISFGKSGRIVRLEHNNKVWVRDTHHEHILNDPKSGGLGAFGCAVAVKNEHFPHAPDNYMWEITDKARRSGFGFAVKDAEISSNGSLRTWNIDYMIWGQPFATAFKSWHISKNRLNFHFAIRWLAAGMYVKEPKIVFHSILGLNYVRPIGAPGHHRWNLDDLPSPKVKTLQIRSPDRRGFRLVNPTHGLVANIQWKDWDRWAQIANNRQRLRPASPEYCHQGPGKTLSRNWESAHWPGDDHYGVMVHSWEGGYGTKDCPGCYRLMEPGDKFSLDATLLLA